MDGLTYEWTAPSGIKVTSCKPYVRQGGFWVHWWHYIKMAAALAGYKWAYKPNSHGA